MADTSCTGCSWYISINIMKNSYQCTRWYKVQHFINKYIYFIQFNDRNYLVIKLLNKMHNNICLFLICKKQNISKYCIYGMIFIFSWNMKRIYWRLAQEHYQDYGIFILFLFLPIITIGTFSYFVVNSFSCCININSSIKYAK